MVRATTGNMRMAKATAEILRAAGIKFDWLHDGLAYPFFSHLAFGVAAGLAGAGLIQVLTRKA